MDAAEVKRLNYSAFCDTTIEHLLKGGATLEFVYRVLSLLLSLSDSGESSCSEAQVRENILVIHEHLLMGEEYFADDERNIHKEVADLLDFRGDQGAKLTDIYTDLKLTSKQDRGAARIALTRLVSKGKVERFASSSYRVVNKDVEEVRFIEKEDDTTQAFPLWLPLGLGDLAEVYAKNIIVIAGGKGAGKTAFALNIAVGNQHKLPVVYLNSEMGDIEFTKRMRQFGFTHADQIKFKVYHRYDHYEDVIGGDKAIYIIDFLEVHDNFYEVAKPIRAIHEKLRDGIAIILIQKKDNELLGRGGDFSREKSRLYLTLQYDEGISQTKVRIADAKFPRVDYPVRGLWRNIKVIGGYRLAPVDDSWRR